MNPLLPLALAALLSGCVFYGTPDETGILTPIGSASTAREDGRNTP